MLLVLNHVHILHVPMKRYRMMGDSVLRGDAVTRTMMWVVALHIRGGGYTCVECIAFNLVLHVSYCGWAEMSFLQVC